jgi:fatty-acyl-CoA synthase
MGTSGTKLERSPTLQEQTISVVRQLLNELGAARGIEELTARGHSAHLERELGLGSLERVELMLRLGDACGVRLPDRIVASADTVQDLIDAISYEADRERADVGASSGESIARLASRTPDIDERKSDLEAKIKGAETLTEILHLRGLGEPARAHIHLYEEDEHVRVITYGALYERASGAATELRERGLEPGQTVGIMLPTGAEFFYAFAGILLAGGIPVPLYPPFRADRIAEYATRQANILRNAESRFLITFRQAHGLARLLQSRVPSLRGVLNAERLSAGPIREEPSREWRPVKNLAHHARGDDIAFLQYTSGSTGDPKGVTLTHANLLANIRAIVAGLEVKENDVVVSWLPLYHDMGLIGAWMAPLFFGVPLVVMAPLAFLSRPERWLRAIHKHRGTLSPAPNFAYELCIRKIADKDLEGLDLSSWRAALNGAEPVQAGTLDRFASRFAPYGFRREALLPVYGLAENSLAVSAPKAGTGYKVDRIDRDVLESEQGAVPAAEGSTGIEFVSAGRPLPGVEVKIVAADGHEAGDRLEGQLWFRGASATQGYYKNAAATKTLVRSGDWLDSGDRAYKADGEIYITGRAKDLIIKAGRNLYPHEMEEIVGRIPGVRAGCAVAFGVPDERGGTERLIIAAEVRNMADSRHVATQISREVGQAIGMPPDAVETLAPHSIPKTSSGKLRRNETRRLFLEGNLGKKAAPPWAQVAKLAAKGAGPQARAVIKRGAKGCLELIYGICVLAVSGVGMTILWLCVAITRDRMKAARLVKRAAQVMLKVAGIPLRVEGRDALEEAERGACIFTPNHSSYVDILVALALLPTGARFVAKGEALSMPFVGMIMRKMGEFTFDRRDSEDRVKLTEEMDAALIRGESVVIYPEGTFTPMPGIRPFHLGAFKAAAITARPICPVAIRGARQILRDKTLLPKRGEITVTFGPLVTPHSGSGDDWHEIVRLRDRTREIIGENSGEPLL